MSHALEQLEVSQAWRPSKHADHHRDLPQALALTPSSQLVRLLEIMTSSHHLDEKSPPCSQHLCLAAPRPISVNSSATATDLPSTIKEKVSYFRIISYLWRIHPVEHSLLCEAPLVSQGVCILIYLGPRWLFRKIEVIPQATRTWAGGFRCLPCSLFAVSSSSVPGVLWVLLGGGMPS